MNLTLSTCNPFARSRLVKVAALDGSLRSAEKALRNAESTRRKTLEDHIKTLGKANQNLHKQVSQTTAAAAQTSAQAAAMMTQPPPPAAQPVYGMMAMGPGAEGQAGTGQQSTAKTITSGGSTPNLTGPTTALKMPGAPAVKPPGAGM